MKRAINDEILNIIHEDSGEKMKGYFVKLKKTLEDDLGLYHQLTDQLKLIKEETSPDDIYKFIHTYYGDNLFKTEKEEEVTDALYNITQLLYGNVNVISKINELPKGERGSVYDLAVDEIMDVMGNIITSLDLGEV